MALEFNQVSAAYMQCIRCGKLVLKRLTYRYDCRAFQIRHGVWPGRSGSEGKPIIKHAESAQDGSKNDIRMQAPSAAVGEHEGSRQGQA